MTATKNLHSAATPRGDELHELAMQLYELISSGHNDLAFNIDARGPALTIVEADGKRRPVRTGGGEGGADVPAWQRARELRDGVEVDRRFNAWVLAKHLRGRYSVAPAAAGWVQWVALDIDAHPVAGASELVARRLAKAQADRVLAAVWRALDCSAERHPLVMRSPGGGYHVWFPLTRGSTSSNPEHTWPAAVARAWFERHLIAAGLELAPGVLEVFPSGRCLRAPCGTGQQLLQATRPGDPDALGLVPWPGTMANERVDWRGERAALSSPVRRVVPMVRALVAQWEAQRRTLAEWLCRPEASWDPAWGFLGWRTDEAVSLAAEKKSGSAPAIEDCRSQESDDAPGRLVARRSRGGTGPAKGRGPAAKRSGSSSSPEKKSPPSAPEVDLPPDLAGGQLVRGLAFKRKVRRLLAEGITEPGTRHDAVLTLAFYWGATCGMGEGAALARLEAWCAAHSHTGSQLAARPRVFRDTCLREARHYIIHYAARWRFRGQGDGGGLATLTTSDQTVLAAIDLRVRDEAAAILAWLAARADDDGRIGEPVQIATGLLARLCGDRRVDEDGKRRRTTTLAIAELERLGVLTLAANYRVGQRGRVWSCWYQFGSGELPRAVELPVEEWAALAPQRGAVALAPTLAIAAAPSVPEAAPSSPIVTVRVVGERVVPEGLLRVLSDGARGVPRTLLTLAPDVAQPTAIPSARAPWFVRTFQRQSFTPAALWAANAATVIPFPDIAARRSMSRRERLALGGALAAVIQMRGDPPKPPADATPCEPGGELAAEVQPMPNLASNELRAEVAAEVGDAAEAMPLDLIDVVAHAWRAFRRGKDP